MKERDISFVSQLELDFPTNKNKTKAEPRTLARSKHQTQLLETENKTKPLSLESIIF